MSTGELQIILVPHHEILFRGLELLLQLGVEECAGCASREERFQIEEDVALAFECNCQVR